MAPEYLNRARAIIVSTKPSSIECLASALQVKVNTAWSYAGQVVDTWPEEEQWVRMLVHPSLWDALKTVELAEESLKDLMQRLCPCLGHDFEWRCVEGRFAHLRLARLCVRAAARPRTADHSGGSSNTPAHL